MEVLAQKVVDGQNRLGYKHPTILPDGVGWQLLYFSPKWSWHHLVSIHTETSPLASIFNFSHIRTCSREAAGAFWGLYPTLRCARCFAFVEVSVQPELKSVNTLWMTHRDVNASTSSQLYEHPQMLTPVAVGRLVQCMSAYTTSDELHHESSNRGAR